MKPWVHAQISSKRFGGEPDDYIEIHNFFDESKAHVADMRHRIFLHNSFGIWLAERQFGTMRFTNGKWCRLPFILNSDGREVQVRDVGEQHVIDDLGHIPSLEQCIASMPLEEWMGGPPRGRKTVSLAERTQVMKTILERLSLEVD